MRILVLTHCYPSEREPHSGAFLIPWLDEIRAQEQPESVEVVCIGKYSVFSGFGKIRKAKPDLVIAHWLFPSGFVARLSGYPFQVYCHGTDVTMAKRSRFWRFLARWTLKKARARFFVSNWLRSIAENSGIIAKPDRAFVRPMPVNKQIFYPISSIKRSEPPLILYVANFNLQKRHRLLIKALHEITLTDPALEWRAEFIGGHEPPRELHDYAVSKGINDRIKWSGPTTQQKLADKYRLAAVVVHLGENEGYGMSVVEATACGTPALVMRSGGLPEAAGEIGVVDDIGAFIEALRGILRRAHS